MQNPAMGAYRGRFCIALLAGDDLLKEWFEVLSGCLMGSSISQGSDVVEPRRFRVFDVGREATPGTRGGEGDALGADLVGQNRAVRGYACSARGAFR